MAGPGLGAAAADAAPDCAPVGRKALVPAQRRGWDRPAAVFLLFLIVVSVYGQAITHELLYWDDIVNLTNNPYLVPQVDWHGVVELWKEPYAGLFIPATYTFFAVEMFIAQRAPGAVFGQPAAWVFHAGNVVLHFCCAALVFSLLRRLTGRNWPALSGALLFALHPLQVEAVAWATETKTLLAALFGLAAMRLYWIACTQRTIRFGLALHGLALACFLLALLSKPTAVVVPLFAGLLAWIDPQAAPGVSRRSGWQHLVRMLPWLAFAGLLIGRTKALQPDAVVTDVPAWPLRFWVAADAVAFYTAKLFLPWGLAMDYGRTPHAVLAAPPWGALAAALGLALMVVAAWRGQRAALCAALFVVGLLPTLGLVPFEFQNVSTVADRYAYFALLGPALGLTLLLAGPWHAVGWRLLTTAGLILMAALAFRQVGYWQDDQTLCTRGLAINPASHQAHGNLAAVLFRQGDLAGAEGHYRAAVDTAFNDTTRVGDLSNLASVLLRQRRLDEAEPLLNEALALRPNDVTSIGTLADVYAARDNGAAAVELAQRACELAPQYERVWIHLASLELDRNRLDAAEAAFQRAIDLRPQSSDGWRGLAKVAARRQQTERAIECFQAAIMTAPYDWVPRYELALFLYSIDQFPAAARLLREAADHAPEVAAIHHNLATTLARLGQSREAAAEYRQALTLDPQLTEAAENLHKLEQLLQR